MGKGIYRAVIASTLLMYAALASAAVHVYTNQPSFMNDLTALGYITVHEGFEDDVAWGHVRTTIVGGTFTAPSVTNLGITWAANNTNGEVTTGDGPALTGAWGFFCLPHGDFVNGITDGFVGTSSDTLYGIGGWIETNTPPAQLALVLDGKELQLIDFGDVPLETRHKFFGVIDTEGFTKFEYRETEGQIDDQKFIFADDFTFARGSATSGNIAGFVTDQIDQPISGASVTAINVTTRERTSVITAPDGSYSFAGLVPSIYRLVCRKRQYKPTVVDSVAVLTGEITSVNIELVPR